jgi:hypothetical protein
MNAAAHRNHGRLLRLVSVMIKRTVLILTMLGSLLVAAPAANAAFTVGIGDQDPAMFNNGLWKDLKLKKVRYLTPWNAAKDPGQLAETKGYMDAARAAKQEVLVHFTAIRGCFNDGKYSRSKKCKAPSVAAYTSAFKAFKKQFPYVKVYGSWNEANHVSQPIRNNPTRAAQYYTALKRNCKGCKVIAGDLLDSSNLRSYASRMNSALKGKARIWGLHNYADVNRKRSRGVTTMLRTVPGEVWLTETGGIVAFAGANGFKPSETAASRAISYMFSLAAKYDSKLPGYRSRVTRLYPYEFNGADAGARFDAGLLRPDGTPRKGYATFKSKAARARK